MLSKFVTPGDRIELQAVERLGGVTHEDVKKVFISQIYDIISDDTIEIAMPMEKSKLVLLPVGGEYELVFYSESGPFQCFARVTERYKSNNVYLLAMELTTNLRKYQRREYYRFSCVLEMGTRTLLEDELQAVKQNTQYVIKRDLPLKSSIIVDISGGGIRFMSSEKYEIESIVYCSYQLVFQGQRKQYDIIGEVLSVKELENRPGTYEHRVQYINIDADIREEIIKFIFEEERKERQRERERL